MGSLSDDYPFVVHEHVRRRDLDASDRVNNAVYATYIEQARAAILGHGSDFILARLEIDFRDPARCGELVEIHTRCSRLGVKSLELEHRLLADGRLVAEGRSVVVGYDAARRRTVELPDGVRSLLTP